MLTFAFINPLNTDEFFCLAQYSEPEIAHCTYQSDASYNFQTKMFLVLQALQQIVQTLMKHWVHQSEQIWCVHLVVMSY